MTGNVLTLEETLITFDEAAADKTPLSALRWGDGENMLFTYPEKRISGAYLKYINDNMIHRDSILTLVSKTEEAVKRCDLFGTFMMREKVGDPDTEKALRAHNVSVDGKRWFYAFDNIFWCTNPLWAKILSSHRIALVGRYMGEWEELIHTHLPAASLTVVTKCVEGVDSVKENHLTTPKTTEDVEAILRMLDSIDYDVCLTAMGLWDMWICDHVRSTGRVGIDYGHGVTHMLWEPEKGFTLNMEAFSEDTAG